jgi:hypothetical protein
VSRRRLVTPLPTTEATTEALAEAPAEPAPTSPVSGVVRKDDLDAWQDGDAPPWPVVQAYLERGEQREWIEAHAAGSPAFAAVLAALRNDAEERDTAPLTAPPCRR